jgi:uncharacterized FAD-dependent dehydrogenase
MNRYVDTTAQSFDIAIVGAGPAGLLAAAALAANSRKQILLLDKGNDIDVREHHPGSREWVEGVGGAGLFSDGKLCLSLDVGGHLRESLDEDEKTRLLEVLETLFRRALAQIDASDVPLIQDRGSAPDIDGLAVTTYPIMHIGTDRGTQLIRVLVDAVKRLGVVVRSNCELLSIERTSRNGWRLRTKGTLGGEEQIGAGSVILAMGKVGSQRQADICERHGAKLVTVPMYMGARFECDAAAVRHLFGDGRDLKWKIHFPDGTKIKTHCATIDGEIATLRYGGLPLAGGHGYSDRASGRSGFAILWDGIRREDNFECALSLMRRISDLTGGALLAQRVLDFRDNRVSTVNEIRSCRPSLAEWGVGNLREFLPEAFTNRLISFLTTLEQSVPDLYEANAILVAPAIEWWMRRVAADPRTMRTEDGIYVCGDGSGWSQGIIHAAATGILAAEDLLGTKVAPQRFADSVFVGRAAQIRSDKLSAMGRPVDR